MKVSEMLDEIHLLVKDPAFFAETNPFFAGTTARDYLLRLMHEALFAACSFPGIEIPMLKKLGSFTTDPVDAYTTVDGVAANFSGRILRIGEPGTIKVYSALEDLFDDYYPLDVVGDVEAVCIAGNVIWYQGIPSTPTDIICILQDDPPTIEDDDDFEIPLIPEAFQRRIIAHGVAAMIYDNIEDGIDGAKVNTESSKREVSIGIQKWMEFLGQRRQHCKTSHWRY